jgi:hypothetical protein
MKNISRKGGKLDALWTGPYRYDKKYHDYFMSEISLMTRTTWTSKPELTVGHWNLPTKSQFFQPNWSDIVPGA